MAVSPIGNMIYINQNMQVLASKQNDFQARLDAQNMAASQAANDKEKEIEQVRPTEEAHKIDPEKEHEKEKKDQEQSGQEQHNRKKQEETKKSTSNTHILDVKI